MEGRIAVEMKVHGFDFDDGLIVFINPEVCGLRSRVTEFNVGADIFGRDFIDGGIDRDGGVVPDHSLKGLKEILIDFEI